MSFVDADNKIVGFDIDVANAVCKEMQSGVLIY
ncbi:arginine ABC transporter substrate-binding protein [Salmonella enterica subsp. enterica]|uniref:Arginine ABC transporter substrate-binding protein n=1 Tax=Salmonella enterica I TaxID=59201 RepID=A0A447TPE0_SALET|nr:arginine ABC transporter substrate-binding protein [Salmonella enterica subsp. enterica]